MLYTIMLNARKPNHREAAGKDNCVCKSGPLGPFGTRKIIS